MIKRISFAILSVVFCLSFVPMVNAQEQGLDNIATIRNVIGGSDKEIIQNSSDTSTYKYYYKTVQIDDSEFGTYVSSKYIVDNGNDASDEYVAAQSRMTEYETSFYGYIPNVDTPDDLSDWTKSTDNEITLENISYQAGTHHGYVIAVAATKDGDNNVYVTRMILESTSATTLGQITYNDNDAATYNQNTQDVTTNQDTVADTNPDTGIEDWVVYFVPASIILGSTILLRRSFA